MKKAEFILLFLILLGAVVVRLYRFDSPIADWHAWRQADTSSVSRNFVERGFDLLHPRFDDLSNVPSRMDNPNGYRFVEFPIYNILQAGAFVIFDFLTIEEWGRIVTIISSVFSSFFLYLLVKKYMDKTSAILSVFFFTFLPFNIYFGRTILPDPSMVMAILGGTYFFDKWIKESSKIKIPFGPSSLREFTSGRAFSTSTPRSSGRGQKSKLQIKDQIFFILSIIFTASSLLLKPYAIFFTLPMIYVAYKQFGFSMIRKWQLWLFVISCLTPLILWRLWMQQFPQGIPASTWLFNADNMRFKGAFFYWLFADRIGRLILGYWGTVFLMLGMIRNLGNGKYFFYSFIASSLLYMVVIARGNIQHDYYQISIMPTIAIFLGLGASFLLNTSKEYFDRFASYIVFFVIIVFSLAFSWYFVGDYFNINNPSIVSAGKAVDSLTPKDALVIAPNEGDTSFLYQTKRKGWASFEKPLAEMVGLGADYLVLTNPTQKDFDGIGSHYKVIAYSSEYIIFDLKQKP